MLSSTQRLHFAESCRTGFCYCRLCQCVKAQSEKREREKESHCVSRQWDPFIKGWFFCRKAGLAVAMWAAFLGVHTLPCFSLSSSEEALLQQRCRILFSNTYLAFTGQTRISMPRHCSRIITFLSHPFAGRGRRKANWCAFPWHRIVVMGGQVAPAYLFG